jgi:hypothetical protein
MAAIRNTTTSTIQGFRARSNPSFQSALQEQDFLGDVEMNHAAFACAAGHDFTIPFAAQAEIPDEWVCLKHQKPALRVGAEAPEAGDDESATQTPMYPGGWFTKHHWKCLQERRTPEEAETILNNALAKARARLAPSEERLAAA